MKGNMTYRQADKATSLEGGVISFKDALVFLFESWKMIAVGGIIGILLAIGYVFIAPPKYQAVINIQVARVAGLDVESADLTIEKLRMPMFYSTASQIACGLTDDVEPSIALANSIKKRISKTTSVVELSFTSNSPGVAQKCVDAVFLDIQNSQNLIAAPIIEVKNNQLRDLKRKVSLLEESLREITARKIIADSSDLNFPVFALLISLRQAKEIEITSLQSKISDLEVSLKEPSTRKVSLMTPISIVEKKSSEGIIPLLIFALGLFLGIMFMFCRRISKAYKIF